LFRILLKSCLFALLLAFVYFSWLFGSNPSQPIPRDDVSVASYIGAPATKNPIPALPLPAHPWLAPQGNNSMHNDSYQSDTYPWMGPLGIEPIVNSQQFHRVAGSCVSATWDKQGRMIQTCVTPFGVTLVARDPATLNIIARKKITHWLPIGQKFSGGVYFHLDHEDKVLLASNDPAIERWELVGEESPEWRLLESIDLAAALDAVAPAPHAVIDVMPDFNGNYWFVSRGGLVGVSDRSGNDIQVIALEGEGIDNALAIGKKGVFVVSNNAMYRFERAKDGSPMIVWREEYDRGSAPKPGTMGHGSGTTPTLIADDYVAITDNADGQVNVVVYRQDVASPPDDQWYCKQPVFPAGRGTSENSMSAVGNSLIVENNYGYQGPYENITAEPGLARIDIDSRKSSCHIAWENRSISSPSAVPKVSLANGLIYIYTRDPANDPALQAWYFTAVDFYTGELAFKVLTGVGAGYNNHYGSMSLGQDGVMYLGVLQGLVSVKDGAHSSD